MITFTNRTFTNRTGTSGTFWIGPLLVLGLSVIACGPRPDDMVLETPFSPGRRSRPPRIVPSPTR